MPDLKLVQQQQSTALSAVLCYCEIKFELVSKKITFLLTKTHTKFHVQNFTYDFSK